MFYYPEKPNDDFDCFLILPIKFNDSIEDIKLHKPIKTFKDLPIPQWKPTLPKLEIELDKDHHNYGEFQNYDDLKPTQNKLRRSKRKRKQPKTFEIINKKRKKEEKKKKKVIKIEPIKNKKGICRINQRVSKYCLQPYKNQMMMAIKEIRYYNKSFTEVSEKYDIPNRTLRRYVRNSKIIKNLFYLGP